MSDTVKAQPPPFRPVRSNPVSIHSDLRKCIEGRLGGGWFGTGPISIQCVWVLTRLQGFLCKPPGLAPGLTLGLSSSLNPGLALGLNTGLNPGLAPGLNPGLALGLNTGLNPGLALGLTLGLAPGLAPGLQCRRENSIALDQDVLLSQRPANISAQRAARRRFRGADNK